MIELKEVTVRIGQRVLLERATGTIYASDKLGLVGRNGCGKTTLLSLLLGKIDADSGEVAMPEKLRYAHLEQEVPCTDTPAIEYVKSGDQLIFQLLQQAQEAEQIGDYVRAAELHSRLYELEADKLHSRASCVMLGLGFEQNDLTKPVSAFSGGWRMRLNLAKVLVSGADLLLLDEPTNYLDIEAIWWLENYLRNFCGIIVVISHDRDFLDHIVNRIWAIHQQKLEQYSGNYSDYQRQRAERIANQQQAWRNQQATIKHLSSYIERFRSKATKARQAQSRIKLLEKMERIEVLRQESPYNFSFRESVPGGTPLLRMHDVDLGYGERAILTKVQLTIHPQERVAILGANGAGKSTLLRSIAGVLPPMDTSGHKAIAYSNKLQIGYFAQHQMDQFDGAQNCYQLIQTLDARATEQQIRSYLGGFGFTGDRIFEPLNRFSGGEKARFTLAWLIWQRPNFLLLDEPTNHLDLEMREALAYALQGYDGALLLVAHDRHLLASSVDSFYEIYDGKLSPWNGSLEEYYTLTTERKKIKLKTSGKSGNVNKSGETLPASFDRSNTNKRDSLAQSIIPQCNKHRRPNKYKIAELEQQIADLEQQIAEINAALQTTGLDKDALISLSQKLTDLSAKLSAKEEQWLQLTD